MSFEISPELYDLLIGRYGARLSAELIRVAGVTPGDRALDVGCGPGALTAALVETLGPGRVTAIEPSRSFAAACRERVPGAEVLTGSAEQLPFEDGAFDVVLSQLVVNFMADAAKGVAEMARVARRTVAACVWDYGGSMTALHAFWDGARELDPSAPDEALTMSYCREGDLGDLFDRCGLAEVQFGSLLVEAHYAGMDDFWAPFPHGVGPSGAYCVTLPPERQAALKDAIHRRLGSPPGPFTLAARAWFATGRTYPLAT